MEFNFQGLPCEDDFWASLKMDTGLGMMVDPRTLQNVTIIEDVCCADISGMFLS